MPRGSRIHYPVKAVPPKPFLKRPPFASVILLAFAGLAVGLWYVVGLPALAINQIEVSGATGGAEEIRQAVEAMIAGKLWGLVPRNNFFAVSGGHMEQELRRRFPEFASVSVTKRFPQRMMVAVAGRELWGIYCERPSVTATPRGCGYLDVSGTAYEELGAFSGWLLPVIYGPEPARLGEPAVVPGTLEFFDSAKAGLVTLDGRLIAMTRSTTTPYDVRLDLAEGWYLWVTPDRPIGEWIGVLETVLAKEIGERRSELEYVDLRFGQKVFYKFR